MNGTSITQRECRLCGVVRWIHDERDICAYHNEDGTLFAELAAQPTAAGGTANAQRQAEGLSEASADEARALTAGAAKLRIILETGADEARALAVLAKNASKPTSVKRLNEIAAELIAWSWCVGDIETEAPAVSAGGER